MTNTTKKLDVLLNESFLLYRENFLRLFNVILLVAVPLIALYHYLSQTGFPPDLELMYALIQKKVADSEGYLLTSSFTYLFTLLGIMTGQIALIRMIKAAFHQVALSTLGAYREALLLFGPYCVFLSKLSIKVLLWSLLLLVPGIYVSFLYSLSHFAFLIDDKRGKEALDLSQRIMKIHWGKFIGYTLIVFVLMVLIFFLADIWFANLFGVNEEGETRIVPFFGQALFTTVVMNLVIFMTVFTCSLYNDFKKSLE